MPYCVLVYVNMDARAEWCNICHTACSSMLCILLKLNVVRKECENGMGGGVNFQGVY